MAPGANGTPDNVARSTNATNGQQPSSDRDKAPRHPRWTRQETLVLIDGKRDAEERGRRGRRSSYVFGSNQVEPKWDYVSSYCRQHGVNRGPVQCRKRWSNLVSDFKKIKTWEAQVGREGEGFWTMRSDGRRARKLPGFFDQEIFDVLDGKASTTCDYQLALVTTSEDQNNGDHLNDVELEDEDEECGHGMCPGFEQAANEGIGCSSREDKAQKNGIPSPAPIAEMRIPRFYKTDSDQENRRQPSPHFRRDFKFQEGAKRRRHSSSDYESPNMNEQIVEALERNNNLLKTYLEHQKSDSHLNREQHDNLIASFTKITNVLEKISDKL